MCWKNVPFVNNMFCFCGNKAKIQVTTTTKIRYDVRNSNDRLAFLEFRVIFQLHFLGLRLIFYFFLMKTSILLELLLLVLVLIVLKILVAKNVYWFVSY